jgi:hypothetical protein
MSLYELEVGWAETSKERRYLDWELLACEEVLGVFPAPREGALVVLFAGEPWDFREWASSVATRGAA